MLFRKQYLPWRLEKAAYVSWVRLSLVSEQPTIIPLRQATQQINLIRCWIATIEAKRDLDTTYVRNCLWNTSKTSGLLDPLCRPQIHATVQICNRSSRLSRGKAQNAAVNLCARYPTPQRRRLLQRNERRRAYSKDVFELRILRSKF